MVWRFSLRTAGTAKPSITAFALGVLLLAGMASAQITHNLQVIWTGKWPAAMTGVPESCETYGLRMCSGDFNGDGVSDLAVACWPVFYVGALDTPCSYVLVYFGRRGAGLDTNPDVTLKTHDHFDSFGRSVCSGDINHDGYDDLVVGAPLGTMSPDSVPKAYVYLGPLGPHDTIPDYVLKRRWIASQFGEAVACGDVNGDGYDDVIVGAYGDFWMPGGQYMGRVYVYYGGPVLDTLPDVILNGGHNGDYEGFGSDLGRPMDLNRDDIADLLAGAWDYGNDERGRFYVYNGSRPMDTIADVTMSGEQGGQHLTMGAITSLRNAQGFNAAAVGSPTYGLQGKFYVLFGGTPMDSVPDLSFVGRTAQSELAASLSYAGRILPNGSDGIIAGAPLEPGDRTGAAYVWEGEPYLDTIPDAWMQGTQPDQCVGSYVCSAGDVDGDGRDEIAISNEASDLTPKRVWVCRYLSSGVGEENRRSISSDLSLMVHPSVGASPVTVSYVLAAKGAISLRILDVQGRGVQSLVTSMPQDAQGVHRVTWDLKDSRGKEVPSGVYFAELITDAAGSPPGETKKITCKFLVAR